jgi:hypothetical protein
LRLQSLKPPDWLPASQSLLSAQSVESGEAVKNDFLASADAFFLLNDEVHQQVAG